MATVLFSNFGAILLAVADYLSEQTDIDRTRVIISVLDGDEVPHFSAAQDIILRPLTEHPEIDIIDGGGRENNARNRELEVIARTRVQLDQAGHDAQRLTNVSLGHLALEDAICDALELYWPVDLTGNALTLPFRMGTLTMPRRSSGKSKESGWVYSTWSVAIEYARDLTQRG